MKNSVEEILRSCGFKKTETRKNVLKIFLKSKYALSSKDIEAKLNPKPDRVTLFRILKDFEDKCIIHKIADTDGQIQFAYCHHLAHEHTQHHHQHNHIHFSCTKCNNTYCLEEINLPHIHLPAGFIAHEWNFQAKGICKNCN